MSISMCNCTSAQLQENNYRKCEGNLTYNGAVLETYEKNGYNDSDFFAIVWDEESQTVRHIEYASTRGWTYHNLARVDATEEVKASALAFFRPRYATSLVDRARRDASVPVKGSEVRSITTRGKNKGVTGLVRWIGEDKYANPYGRYDFTPLRVGIKVDGEDKLRFLPISSVQLVTIPEINETELRARAASWTPANWQSAQYALISLALR